MSLAVKQIYSNNISFSSFSNKKAVNKQCLLNNKCIIRVYTK
jgi:hypothetical protein